MPLVRDSRKTPTHFHSRILKAFKGDFPLLRLWLVRTRYCVGPYQRCTEYPYRHPCCYAFKSPPIGKSVSFYRCNWLDSRSCIQGCILHRLLDHAMDRGQFPISLSGFWGFLNQTAKPGRFFFI